MPYTEQFVTSFQRWSDKTFSFKTTRPTDFHFENGEFVTIGLRPEGKLIARAYSIVSSNDADHLEFLSIHVPEGPLTSRLARIETGDSVWVNNKATGSLTLKHVQPGRHLYLLATGTGLAPFVCLVRSPEVYDAFERVILVHTVRTVKELAYKDEIESLTGGRFFYVPCVTREPFRNNIRCSDLFKSGELFSMTDSPHADPELDRVLICGNPEMVRDMRNHLNGQGWTMTNHSGVGNYSVEKAFVVHHS
ncbi:MAG: ferredoxin--NADP reductase [Gammaproteobacteria bacterium]|nr:ferredoxin--NADP reductase [Gammaproteobacteria bacterium]